MTHMNSVDTDSPPGQATAVEIWSRRIAPGTLVLKYIGGGNGVLELGRDDPERYGDVAFDGSRDRHVIKWNRTARMMLGRSDLEALDWPIRSTMAAYTARDERGEI